MLALSASTEIAGLVGDVKFVKAEVEGQKHVALGPVVFGFPILNLSLSYHVGTVKSYGSEQHRPARISDRFFLGGPMNVRGFNHKGIGPRASPLDGGVAQGDALGGDVSYNGTASLGFPLPLPLFAVSLRCRPLKPSVVCLTLVVISSRGFRLWVSAASSLPMPVT